MTQAESKNFQPANITFDLLPALDRKVRDRKERHRLQCELALQAFEEWLPHSSRQPVPAAVSYTHLDVYKRQRLYCGA